MRRFLLTVDPGKTTGWAIWDREQRRFEDSGEHDFESFCRIAKTHLSTHGHCTTVICERFTITANTAKNSQAPWSLEVIGVMRWLCRLHHAEFGKMQQPSAAMTFATNERLKQIDWYVVGADHERDARRHLLLALVSLGEQPEGTLAVQ